MKKTKKDNDEKIEKIISNLKEMLKNEVIVLSSIQYKNSQEMISHKIENENIAISYGINLINKKILNNLEKHQEIETEITNIMTQYQENLETLSKIHDSQIIALYLKNYEEELHQADIQKQIYYLKKEEIEAKQKLDNSDDDIKEKICDLEDEYMKIEQKIRRIKTEIKKKIADKKQEIEKCMETKEMELQVEKIKGPRIFSKATKFFISKINPRKAIEKNVFTNLKNRIEEYEQEKQSNNRKINEKNLEENILKTIEEIF